MAVMEKAAAFSRVAAVALGILAACLAAAARAVTPGAAAAGAAAAFAAWLAGRLARESYERFVSGAPAWRRDGGLSLVKGATGGPIKL
jgi:hypothetical protein